MFYGCSKFNSDLSWNLKNANNMNGMFQNCSDLSSKLNFNFESNSNDITMQGMFA